MTHIEEYESRVIQYLDGDLDAREAESFAAHLNDCPDCAHALSAHQESLQFVQSALNNPPVSEGVSIQQVAHRIVQRRQLALVAGAASGFVILAAIVVSTISSDPTDRPVLTDAWPAIKAAPTELELRIAILEARLTEVQAEMDRTTAQYNLAERSAYYEFASIAVAAAQHLEESGLDYDGAREQYRFVLDRYPDSPAAATANERLSAMTNSTSTT